MRAFTISLAATAVALLAACAGEPDVSEPQAVELDPAERLQAVIDDPRRDEARARDAFRNPAQTLAFFEIAPGQRVGEIWPGSYADILAPYFQEVGGTYVAVLFPDAMGERMAARAAAFRDAHAGAQADGAVEFGTFGFANGQSLGEIAPEGSLDALLTFRNVHSFMGRGFADEAFAEFYAALKPGGILGVVQHRLPESRVQDPQGGTGYVQESYVKDLAARAGFEFVESSEVNANPLDTADHPLGVWTLPPASRTPEPGDTAYADFRPDLYRNIGESDRMTLKFRKPAE